MGVGGGAGSYALMPDLTVYGVCVCVRAAVNVCHSPKELAWNKGSRDETRSESEEQERQ